MFILFSLIVMRVSGAILFNSLFARRELPGLAKGILIVALSAMLYSFVGGRLAAPPENLLMYIGMLLWELFMGLSLGMGVELTLMVIRFATGIMDFSMGLNMAQIYDPSSSTQSSITSVLYMGFFLLIFFTENGHLRFLSVVFETARTLPFGSIRFDPSLTSYLMETFSGCILLGLELAFPILGIELLTEIALGILMRMIPQINVFSINFQLKLLIGLFMLLFLFHPMADAMRAVIEELFRILHGILTHFPV